MASLQSIGPSLPAVVRDSPLLMQEIDSLRKLFHKERNERIKLENEKLQKDLYSLRPLPTFKNTRDEVLEDLFKEGAALKQVISTIIIRRFLDSTLTVFQEILLALAKPSFPAVYKLKPGNGPAAWQRHFIEENNKIFNLKRRAEKFQAKVAAEAIKRKSGGKIETDLAIFPTKEMTKVCTTAKYRVTMK